jgi:hypothetical protein
MEGIGSIYKSEKEINERKMQIQERNKNRLSQSEIKAGLIKHLDKNVNPFKSWQLALLFITGFLIAFALIYLT